jgi:hypothetical protein
MSRQPIHEIEGKFFAHAHAMSIATSLLKHSNYWEKIGKTSKEAFPLLEEHRRGETIPPEQARIACLTYLAFALEGYLELIGQYEAETAENTFKSKPWHKRIFNEPKVFGICLSRWGKMRTLDRLIIVAGFYGVPVFKGAEPYQTIYRLFKFRNDQAHPKLIKVTKQVRGRDVHRLFDSLTVYSQLVPSDAERMCQLVRELVSKIEASRPDGDSATWLTISQMTASSDG